MNEYDQKDFDNGVDLIENFADLVNAMGQSEFVNGMADGFMRQHRTLQQSVVRSFIEMLGKIGEKAKDNKEMYSDTRNEKAIEFAIAQHHDLANYSLFFPHV